MDRKTTDCGFCLLFLATIFAMVGLAGYGITKGNLMKLIGGVDGNLNICGGTTGYESYKFLYLTDLNPTGTDIKEIFNYGVCVKSCP